jgi:release factor glutamine methyltransferase
VTDPRTFAEAQAWAFRRLRAGNVDDAGTDARWLLSHATDVPRERLTLCADDPLPDGSFARLEQAVARRIAREPVSIITGRKDFYGRSFAVGRSVLSPRPETETLVELALSEPFARVLDLGTGSGCILVSLLCERSEARGVGTDISPQALLIAGENAARLGVAGRLVLPISDWFADIGGRYDLIVSNPPYIAAAEMNCLAPEVRDHEPRAALTDGADGLGAYRAIAAGAPRHLTPSGRLLVEIGPTQGTAVAELFREAGLEDVAVHPDLDGRDRVVSARCGQRVG